MGNNEQGLDLLGREEQELHKALIDLQGTGQELQALSNNYHEFMGLRDKTGLDRFIASVAFHFRTKVKQQDFLDYLLNMISRLTDNLHRSIKELNDLGLSRYDELERLKSKWDEERNSYNLRQLREMCVTFAGEDRNFSSDFKWILAGEIEITSEEDRRQKEEEIKRQIENLFALEASLISLMMSVGIVGLDNYTFNLIQRHALGRVAPLILVCTNALNDMGAATDASVVASQATLDYLDHIFTAANMAVEVTEEMQRICLASPEFAKKAKDQSLELREKILALYGEKEISGSGRLAEMDRLMKLASKPDEDSKKPIEKVIEAEAKTEEKERN